jgi:hypothetical protein
MSEFRSKQAELHGIKEIALSTPIPTNDSICSWREGLSLPLLSEGSEIGQRYLFDVHG